MSSKRVQEIAENYEYYTSLVKERKTIYSNVINVNSQGNNANILEKVEIVKHEVIADDMTFTVNVKLKDHNFFQFKLRYEKFCPRHIFRFDSDGDTHRNKIDGVPFAEQSVPTPHFHLFHDTGVEIAYQTDKLLDPAEKVALLGDINLCLVHFFHESNTRLGEDNFPEVKIMSNTLGLTLSSHDPNENITFI